MGFYGNILYNAYGIPEQGIETKHLQDGTVTAKKLDRVYEQSSYIVEETITNYQELWAKALGVSIAAPYWEWKTTASMPADNVTIIKTTSTVGTSVTVPYDVYQYAGNRITRFMDVNIDNGPQGTYIAWFVKISARAPRMVLMSCKDLSISILYGNADRSLQSRINSHDNAIWNYSLLQIQNKSIANSSISTNKIVDAAITANKIATDAITANKIATDAVTQSKIKANSVGESELIVESVTTDIIANKAITKDKLNDELKEQLDLFSISPLTKARIYNSSMIFTGAADSNELYRDIFDSLGIYGIYPEDAIYLFKIYDENTYQDCYARLIKSSVQNTGRYYNNIIFTNLYTGITYGIYPYVRSENGNHILGNSWQQISKTTLIKNLGYIMDLKQFVNFFEQCQKLGGLDTVTQQFGLITFMYNGDYYIGSIVSLNAPTAIFSENVKFGALNLSTGEYYKIYIYLDCSTFEKRCQIQKRSSFNIRTTNPSVAVSGVSGEIVYASGTETFWMCIGQNGDGYIWKQI